MPFATDMTLIKDAIIIIICATTCLYCIILSKRLKALSSAKSGMVASIVELTQAIQESHKAAQQIQASAQERIETLNSLLEDAERASIKLEAISTDATQQNKTLSLHTQRAAEQIDAALPEAVLTARKTAAALIKLVEKVRLRQNVISKELPQHHATKATLKSHNTISASETTATAYAA